MERKTVYDVLKEFTKILHDVDPMLLNSESADEYEHEALSILARFYESGVIAAPEDVRSEMASSIVSQTLEYWFDEAPKCDCSDMTSRLISVAEEL